MGTQDTVKMGERGPQELVGKLMSKPFQRYVIVARKLAANALPTGYLYT